MDEESSSKCFKEFLIDFCRDHNGPVESDDRLPFRLTVFYPIKREVEGETLNWVLQYLLAK